MQNLIFCLYFCIMSIPETNDKHETIRCERCGTAMVCKANAYTKCQCSVVPLNLNETQYISELYDGCLCATCLFALKEEFNANYSG